MIFLRKPVVVISIFLGVLSTFQSASAQMKRETARNVYGSVCPAPELVKAHIVLDPNAPYTERQGPVMIPPVINGRRIIAVEPKNTNEVLGAYRQDYGLDVPAIEFLAAVITPGKNVMCHYRSDVVEPTISIRSNANQCIKMTGAWNAASSTIDKCEGSRLSCLFRCVAAP